MSEAQDQPNLDDVIEPTEQPHPDRHEHAKMPHPVDDDELARRTEHERRVAGVEDSASEE